MFHKHNLMLLSLAVCAAANISLHGFAAEPNDTFETATVLPAGTLSVSDSLEGGESLPDTYLGFFADDTFPLPPLDEDDDSSPLGNGLADALFDIPVNADGSIPLAVTGCCDDFEGSHSEEGDYALFVDVYDSSGLFLESFDEESFLSPGVVDEFPFSDPAWIGGTFDAVIDNTVGFEPGPDPVDFFVFTGLTPGLTFEAEIREGDFDPILAQLDAAGDLVAIDDDMGEGLLSLLEGTVPANGELVFAVTGFDDFELLGLHSQTGEYALTVSLVPEPGSMALFGVGLTLLFPRRSIAN